MRKIKISPVAFTVTLASLLWVSALSTVVEAHTLAPNESLQPVLADVTVLQKAGVQPILSDATSGVAYALLSPSAQLKVSDIVHAEGRCGGFEVLPFASVATGQQALTDLASQSLSNYAYSLQSSTARLQSISVVKSEAIVEALSQARAENIRETVQWLSSFASRSNKLPEPNNHVFQLEQRLRTLLANYSGQWSVNLIDHSRTKQKSLRVRLEGSTRPEEIIVLGGHLDSIVQWGGAAPGADDNASGSANLLEALRVLVSTQQITERSIEFFWYAGEESGLLGSAEIADQYKTAGKNVIAVLQLDMTMFPGSGELVLANITDFTSAWLRDYLVKLNDMYLQATLIDDSCGYACSDHASWFRRGYPTLMPFEAHKRRMNRNIHTSRDVIDANSSFVHSLVFSKIALAFALDLGNSTESQPYQ